MSKTQNLQFFLQTSLKLIPIWKLNKVWGGFAAGGRRGWGKELTGGEGWCWQRPLSACQPDFSPLYARFATFPSDFAADFLRPAPLRHWQAGTYSALHPGKRGTDNFLIRHTNAPHPHFKLYFYMKLKRGLDFHKCLWSIINWTGA